MSRFFTSGTHRGAVKASYDVRRAHAADVSPALPTLTQQCLGLLLHVLPHTADTANGPKVRLAIVPLAIDARCRRHTLTACHRGRRRVSVSRRISSWRRGRWLSVTSSVARGRDVSGGRSRSRDLLRRAEQRRNGQGRPAFCRRRKPEGLLSSWLLLERRRSFRTGSWGLTRGSIEIIRPPFAGMRFVAVRIPLGLWRWGMIVEGRFGGDASMRRRAVACRWRWVWTTGRGLMLHRSETGSRGIVWAGRWRTLRWIAVVAAG